MTTDDSAAPGGGGLHQMRRLDLLAYLMRRYPRADNAVLGALSRDGLLAWAREREAA